MTAVDHARRELDLLGEDPAFATSIVATVAAFTSYPHSGYSAEIALDILMRLLRLQALTPLTDDPDEWIDRTQMSCAPLWQSSRDSRAFSTDGGRTYTLVGDEQRQVHTSAATRADA